MKLLNLALAGSLLAGGLALAQTTQSLPEGDTPIWATFYDADPYGGDALEENASTGSTRQSVIRTTLNGSTISKAIDGIDSAKYVLLEVDNSALAFEITGGTSTQSIKLANVTDDDVTLKDVVTDMSNALNGDANVAIFIDQDGIVSGFYAFAENDVPTVNVSQATRVALTYDGQVAVFDTKAPGSRSLSNVFVQTADGGEMSLLTLALGSN